MLRLPEYRYHRPRTLREALDLLRENAGNALPVAGGTDLVPNMKHRLFSPAHVVGLRGIAELRGIRIERSQLVIGATETLAAIARHPLVIAHAPSLSKAAGLVAGPQLRNMGTIGGNICLDTRCTYYNQTQFWRQALGFCLKKDGDTCHVTQVGRKCVAAHSADTPPVLMTLDASVDLASADNVRTVTVEELFVADGIWNSVRRPDEILTHIRLPMPATGVRTAFEKLRQRNAIDFPLLNVAVSAKLEGNVVDSMKLVVSALGARPRVVAGLDKVASGQPWSADLVDAIARKAHQQCHPLSNIIVDPDWRRAMVPVYVSRALQSMAPAGQAAA